MSIWLNLAYTTVHVLGGVDKKGELNAWGLLISLPFLGIAVAAITIVLFVIVMVPLVILFFTPFCIFVFENSCIDPILALFR